MGEKRSETRWLREDKAWKERSVQKEHSKGCNDARGLMSCPSSRSKSQGVYLSGKPEGVAKANGRRKRGPGCENA